MIRVIICYSLKVILFDFFCEQDLKTMEQQKMTIEKEHLSSLEKLKQREEEIRQLHKVRMSMASIVLEPLFQTLFLMTNFLEIEINI